MRVSDGVRSLAAPQQPSIFADPNYRAYFAGILCAEAGSQIQYVAIGWQIFVVTHSPLYLGLVGLMMWLPAVLFILVSGMLADRFERRLIVVAGRLGELVCAGTFAAMVGTGVREPAAYLAMIFVLGTSSALSNPAQRTLLPNIVPPRRYANAQATFVSARSVLQMVAPAIGGFIISVSTIAAFGTTGLMALLAAVTLSTLRLPPSERRVEPPSWKTILAGFTFMRGHPIIAGAITLDLFAVLFGGSAALYPIFAATILHAGPIGLGLLRSAPSIGAAGIAAILARRPPRRHVGRTLLCVVTGYGLAIIAFGLSKILWLSLTALAFAGAFDVVSVVIRSAVIQLNTPDAMRGRVSAIESVFIISTGQLGAFESGSVAALIGTVPSVVVGGIGTLVTVFLWAVLFPALRNADQLQSREHA